MRTKHKQLGLTMIELMAVLAISSFMAYVAITRLEAESGDRIIDNAARKAVMVASAAKRYRVSTGAWPSSPSQLVSNGYLTNAQVESGFGTSFSFTTSGSNLVVRHNATDAKWARRLAGRLPEGSVYSSSNVQFLTPPAGSEASLAGLYARDGSRALTGNMDGGGNDASNFDNINANNNITAGNNLYAGNQVNAKRFADSDNTSYYVDPASTSKMNTIEASGRVYGSAFYDSNNNNYYVNPSLDSKLSGDIEVGGDVESDVLRSRTNGSYYVRPNSSSNLRGDITTEGEMQGRIFRDSSDPNNRYVNPGSYSQLSYLRTSAIYDLDNTSFFLNPSSANEAARLNGYVSADRFNFRGTESEGSWCSSLRNEIAVNWAGELMYCNGSNWAMVAESKTSSFVGRNYGMIDGDDYAGRAGYTSTWTFTASEMGIREGAYAVQIYASCGAQDHHNIKYNIKSSASGSTLRLIDTRAAGSGDDIRAMNTIIVPVDGDSSSITISKPSAAQPCEQNGLHVSMIGYFENT